MDTSAPSQLRSSANARPTPSPRRRAPAILLVLVLLVALGALAGCAREPVISSFTVSPTVTSQGLRGITAPQPQAAGGLVGEATTITPPTATAEPSPTPQPLIGDMQPVVTPAPATPQPLIGNAQSMATPVPLVGVVVLQDSAVVAANLIVRGSALQFAGACADAIPLYEQAIAADPSFSNVYALLGLCLYDQGRVDAAIARWQEALQRDPQSPDALAGLGTALYQQGQRDAGLARC